MAKQKPNSNNNTPSSSTPAQQKPVRRKPSKPDDEDHWQSYINESHTKQDVISLVTQLALQTGCYFMLSALASGSSKVFRVKEEQMLLKWHMSMLLVYLASIYITKTTRFYVRYRHWLVLNLRAVNAAQACSFVAALLDTAPMRAGLGEMCWWALSALMSLQGAFATPLSFKQQSVVGVFECAFLVIKPWEAYGRGFKGLFGGFTIEPWGLLKLVFHIFLIFLAVFMLPLHRAQVREKSLKLGLLGEQAQRERRMLKEMLQQKQKTSESEAGSSGSGKKGS